MSTGGPYVDRWQPGIPPQDPGSLWAWLVDRVGNLSRVLGAIQHRTEVAVNSLEPRAVLQNTTALTATSLTPISADLTLKFTPLVTGVARLWAPLLINSGAGPVVTLTFGFLASGGIYSNSHLAAGSQVLGWPTGMQANVACFIDLTVTAGVAYTAQVEYIAGAGGSTWTVLASSRFFAELGVPSSSLALP